MKFRGELQFSELPLESFNFASWCRARYYRIVQSLSAYSLMLRYSREDEPLVALGTRSAVFHLRTWEPSTNFEAVLMCGVTHHFVAATKLIQGTRCRTRIEDHSDRTKGPPQSIISVRDVLSSRP